MQKQQRGSSKKYKLNVSGWVCELSLIFSFSLFHSIVNFVLLKNYIQKLVKVRGDLLAFIFNQQVFKEMCFTGIEH